MKSSQPYLPGALGAALLVLCLAAPAMAQPPAVDEVTVASGVSSRLYNPSVGFADGGGVFAVWEDSASGIEARRIGAAGVLSPAVVLAANVLPDSIPYTGPVTLQRDPLVVPLVGGEFLALWKQEQQQVTVDILYQDTEVVASNLQVRRFNRAGNPVGRQFAVTDGDLGLESAPQAVQLASGRVAVVWHTHADNAPTGVYVRLLGGRGVPHGAPLRVDEPADEAGKRPAVAALADGGFVVAWQQCCDAGGDPDVLARRFDADGVALGAPFVIHGATAGEQVWPAVAAGVDGNLMAAWMGPGTDREGREFRVYGQQITADGTRIGPERVLSSGVGRAHGAPTLAGLPDGYALAWTLWLRNFVGGVYGVALDTAGVPRADAVRLSQGSVRFQWELALTTDPAGNVLAAWQGYSPSGQPAINVWSLSPVR